MEGRGKKSNKGFVLYLLFIVSWFTHLSGRIAILGAIRFDLLLVAGLFFLALLQSDDSHIDETPCRIGNYLIIIMAYSLLTLPFVEWPGSVLNHGIPLFIKAVVFYFFTVKFIQKEKELKTFMTLFLGAQSFRILEPLYLHVTQGYWGSKASMANWEFMNRLSGAPHDIVNPNGLAFIIVSIIPFFYYYAGLNKKIFSLALVLLPSFIWALVLTASRSGFVALLVIIGSITLKSKHKFTIITVALLCASFAYSVLTPDQKDRYLSIVSHDTKNAATSEGRLAGLYDNLKVGLRKPIFGHGLGTSLEANANFGHSAQPAHNLYAEIFQELGIVGLGFFLLYIKAVVSEVRKGARFWRQRVKADVDFINATSNALLAFFVMNLVFSLASFGLSGYEWYLIPGLIVVLSRLQRQEAGIEQQYRSTGNIA